jgi:hypothetical protein
VTFIMLSQTRRLFGFENIKSGTGNCFFNSSFILWAFPQKIRLECRSRTWNSIGGAVRGERNSLRTAHTFDSTVSPNQRRNCKAYIGLWTMLTADGRGTRALGYNEKRTYVTFIKMWFLAWKNLNEFTMPEICGWYIGLTLRILI